MWEATITDTRKIDSTALITVKYTKGEYVQSVTYKTTKPLDLKKTAENEINKIEEMQRLDGFLAQLPTQIDLTPTPVPETPAPSPEQVKADELMQKEAELRSAILDAKMKKDVSDFSAIDPTLAKKLADIEKLKVEKVK